MLLVVELSALCVDDCSIVASRCDHHGMVVCQTVSWDLSITMFSLRRRRWRRTERKKLLPQTYGAMPRSVGAKLVIGKNGERVGKNGEAGDKNFPISFLVSWIIHLRFISYSKLALGGWKPNSNSKVKLVCWLAPGRPGEDIAADFPPV